MRAGPGGLHQSMGGISRPRVKGHHCTVALSPHQTRKVSATRDLWEKGEPGNLASKDSNPIIHRETPSLALSGQELGFWVGKGDQGPQGLRDKRLLPLWRTAGPCQSAGLGFCCWSTFGKSALEAVAWPQWGWAKPGGTKRTRETMGKD